MHRKIIEKSMQQVWHDICMLGDIDVIFNKGACKSEWLRLLPQVRPPDWSRTATWSTSASTYNDLCLPLQDRPRRSCFFRGFSSSCMPAAVRRGFLLRKPAKSLNGVKRELANYLKLLWIFLQNTDKKGLWINRERAIMMLWLWKVSRSNYEERSERKTELWKNGILCP